MRLSGNLVLPVQQVVGSLFIKGKVQELSWVKNLKNYHHETARVQLLPVGRRNRKFYTMLNSHPAELWNWPLQPHKQIKEVLIKIASVSLQQEVITLQFFQSYLSSENIWKIISSFNRRGMKISRSSVSYTTLLKQMRKLGYREKT